MAGLSTNASGLWGGFAGLLYGSTALSTPPGFLADATPAWVLPGAALDLDFADSLGYNSRNLATTTPDSILTYTNPSAKLVYGSDGVLGYAPHNLQVYSNDFANAAWTKNSCSVSSEGIAPDGTVATKLTNDTATNAHGVFDATVFTAPYTYSVYMKAGTAQYGGLSSQTSAASYAVFDLSNGTINSSSGVTAAIEAAGDGWYRCSITQLTVASTYVIVSIVETSGVAAWTSYTGTTKNIYISGAQVNLGSSALTYVPTTTAARYSLPIDHNPTTFDPLGVLIEEQRTNLLLRSQDFSASWILLRLTLSTKIAAPDGTTTADLLLDTAVAGTHVAIQTISKAASSIVYNSSVYVKANVRDIVEFRVSDQTGNGVRAVFNLTTATITTAATAYGAGFTAGSSSITSVGNGWYRIELSATSNTAIVLGQEIYVANASGNISYTGNGSGLYAWGAQLEAGAFPTSYIPTVASQVTRAADQVSILTSAFGYNAAEGTLAAQATTMTSVAPNRPIGIFSDGTNNERIMAYVRDGNAQLVIIDGGATQAGLIAGAITNGVEFKIAAAWAANDVATALDGGAVATDGAATLPTVTTLSIGRNPASASEAFNGTVKRLTYFPTRRSNADLQVLST